MFINCNFTLLFYFTNIHFQIFLLLQKPLIFVFNPVILILKPIDWRWPISSSFDSIFLSSLFIADSKTSKLFWLANSNLHRSVSQSQLWGMKLESQPSDTCPWILFQWPWELLFAIDNGLAYRLQLSLFPWFIKIHVKIFLLLEEHFLIRLKIHDLPAKLLIFLLSSPSPSIIRPLSAKNNPVL